jgi:hypothetical protein
VNLPFIGWCKSLEAIVPKSENYDWAGTCYAWEIKNPNGGLNCKNCKKFMEFKEEMK